MGIGDPCSEELIGGKEGIGAGALEHGRDRSDGIQGLGGGQKGSLGRGTVHGDLGNDNYLYQISHPWGKTTFQGGRLLLTEQEGARETQSSLLRDTAYALSFLL